jgi:hypothetical protein
VRNHRRRIYEKIGISTERELFLRFLRPPDERLNQFQEKCERQAANGDAEAIRVSIPA